MVQTEDPRALTCDSHTFLWEPLDSSATASPNAIRNPRPSNKFFNRGQPGWPLIEQNKSVAPRTYWASASAVEAPASVASNPCCFGFSVSAKNYFGVAAFAITYQFVLVPGGDSNHPQQYITRLEIAPLRVEVASGWTVNLTAVIQGPQEFGEADNPIALLPAQLILTVDTTIKSIREDRTYLVYPGGVLPV